MAKLIRYGNTAIDASEIVQLMAEQEEYPHSTKDSVYKVSYFLRGISIQFHLDFGNDMKGRNEKYFEILKEMGDRICQ